jgi:sugar phosphate isomerase/epimerase
LEQGDVDSAPFAVGQSIGLIKDIVSCKELLDRMVKEAEETGLTLVIENVFEETPNTIKTLLEEIHSPYFRFCFDTGHHHVFSKVPVPIWFETLGQYLCEVHLHDNHKEMDEHLPVGEGGFDFDQFFDLLVQFKLNPIYTIEPHEEAHLWRGLEAVRKYINT